MFQSSLSTMHLTPSGMRNRKSQEVVLLWHFLNSLLCLQLSLSRSLFFSPTKLQSVLLKCKAGMVVCVSLCPLRQCQHPHTLCAALSLNVRFYFPHLPFSTFVCIYHFFLLTLLHRSLGQVGTLSSHCSEQKSVGASQAFQD